jgi:hypothetical protein
MHSHMNVKYVLILIAILKSEVSEQTGYDDNENRQIAVILNVTGAHRLWKRLMARTSSHSRSQCFESQGRRTTNAKKAKCWTKLKEICVS